MLEKYNKWRVLKVFFDDPITEGSGFQLREISRKLKLAPISIKRYLDELAKEDLIVKGRHRIHDYPIYWANRSQENFRLLKKLNTILSIKESGLLEFLNNQCMPDVIVLFGSTSRGEDTAESDIDLFIESKERALNLERFEKILKRKISLFFSEDYNKLSKELKNNIINGVILNGYLKVF